MSEQSAPLTDQTLTEPLPSRSSPLSPVTLTEPLPSVGTPEPASEQQPHLGRFDVQGELGRGGMGAVLRGRDPTLGRELAIKVLLARHRGNADAVRRFHEEAQIGGQLQHPGLVPVYELGTDEQGRPFFAMKLVDGRTLADLLKGRESPLDDLPRFLTIFEQVCQAVGYAHARGVIHRDLKPANVMVGAFGEVQVVDWGLAKLLSNKNAETLTSNPALAGMKTVEKRPESHASESRAGSVVGTPAYMPPEQARGEIERLDQRADVFGLGAILCEILTGQPPFPGGNVSEALGRSARGDLADTFARLDSCGADAELVSLARKCLAADPAARPRDGAVVAAEVAAYRASVAERLRTAELERAAAEGRAVEERRRRRTQLALAAVVLLLLMLAGGGGWYVRHQQIQQRQQQERKQLEVERAVEQDLAEVAERQGQARWTDAWAALERAEGRLGQSGEEALRERVADARRKLEQMRTDRDMVARLEEARSQRISVGGRQVEAKAFQDAFTGYGLDVDKLNPELTAARIRASAVREALVSGLYQWATVIGDPKKQNEETMRLLRIAVAADPDPCRRQLAETAMRNDRAGLLKLAEQADPAKLSPSTAVLVATCYEVAGQSAKALPLLRQVQQRHPDDFLLTFAVAQYSQHLVRPPQLNEALRHYTAALALRPRNAGVLIELGNTLKKESRFPEAIQAYREACRLKPESAGVRTILGFALYQEGKEREAEAVCREAVHLQSDYAEGQNILGIVLREEGKVTEAEAVCREAIRLKPDNARAHCSLGFVLRLQGQFQASLVEFRRGHELNVKPSGWHGPTAQWLHEAEQIVDLDRRLPDVLAGKTKPANALEELEFGQVAGWKGHYAAAVRLHTDAFKADPSLASELVKGRRYAASRYAVLAAARSLDEPESVRLRKQALDWLHDDLAGWSKRLDKHKPGDRVLVESRMRHWQQDPALAGVRDVDALAKLPEKERAAWRQCWQNVADLLKGAAAMTPPAYGKGQGG